MASKDQRSQQRRAISSSDGFGKSYNKNNFQSQEKKELFLESSSLFRIPSIVGFPTAVDPAPSHPWWKPHRQIFYVLTGPTVSHCATAAILMPATVR